MRIDEVVARPRTVSRSRPCTIELRTDQVEAIMRQLQWNPPEVARRLGIDPSSIYKLLRGEQQLGIGSLAGLLVTFLDVFPDETLGGLFARLFCLYEHDEDGWRVYDVAATEPRRTRSGPPRRPTGGPRRPVVGGPEDPPAEPHEPQRDADGPREEADVPALTT